MEPDNTQQKTNNRISETFRWVFYVVVVVFLVLWNTFLFLEHRHTKQRLSEIEDKMIIEQTLKKFFLASQSNSADKHERLDGKVLLVKEKRALALSLESLEKRVKVLEFRWDFVFLHNMRHACVMHHCAKRKQAYLRWKSARFLRHLFFLTRMITRHQLLILLGSKHLLCYILFFIKVVRRYFLILRSLGCGYTQDKALKAAY